jgi:iron complex outermembrane receptor protein
MFGEGSYTRNQFNTISSETPADGLVLPESSPHYPTAWLQANYPAAVGQPLTVSLRTVEMGARTKEATSEQERAVAGLKGTIKGWDFDAAFNYNRSKVSESFIDGWLDLRFVPLFRTGVINPFGPNTPEVLAQMSATKFNGEMQRATSTMQVIDLKTSGEVVELAAGPLALALGGEYRKEDLVQWRAPIYEQGQYVGAAASSIPTVPPKERTVGSLFAEAYIPIVKNLEAQAAVRYDDYSDFGGTTNWKLALRWQPARQVLFRGSWNTGFHAPSLLELYQPLYKQGSQVLPAIRSAVR